MSKSRSYCFTLNNYTEDVYQHLLAVECKYVIIGKEVGESGTPHLQGYFYFTSPRTLSSCKKINAMAHWEASKGLPSQNRTYCSKDGKFEEVGSIPKDPADKGKMEQDAYADALVCVQEGRPEDMRPDILVRNLKQVEYAAARIKASKRKLDDLSPDVVNEWIWGPTGTGKSHVAREENPGLFSKLTFAKWWDGYEFEDVVLIEDVDMSAADHPGQYKIWLDKYVFPAEIKGSTVKIRPKKVVVTSNYHPADIWHDTAALNPILRRVVLRHRTEVYVPPAPRVGNGEIVLLSESDPPDPAGADRRPAGGGRDDEEREARIEDIHSL